MHDMVKPELYQHWTDEGYRMQIALRVYLACVLACYRVCYQNSCIISTPQTPNNGHNQTQLSACNVVIIVTTNGADNSAGGPWKDTAVRLSVCQLQGKF